jgi:glycosyltransferase involved in cell wall biosynthesis
MSVYNGERYLRQAVDSILNQTFTDFEFIIADDGSTDSTAAILDSYDDARIVRLRNKSNIGLTRSLNRGLHVAEGTYIARQDADDVSLPERLERQVAFLDSHPAVGLAGSNYFLVDRNGAVLGDVRGLGPLGGDVLKWRLLWGNTFAHPSVMFRHHLVQALGGYPEDCAYAQDYVLWLRLCLETDMAVLAQPLICLRKHDSKISVQHPDQQFSVAVTASQRALSRLTSSIPSLGAVQLAQGFIPADAGLKVEEAAELVCLAYQSFVATHNPRREDRDTIRVDAAQRLSKLALIYVGVHPASAFRAFLAALSMTPSWKWRLSFLRGFLIRLVKGAASRISRLTSHSQECAVE